MTSDRVRLTVTINRSTAGIVKSLRQPGRKTCDDVVTYLADVWSFHAQGDAREPSRPPRPTPRTPRD